MSPDFTLQDLEDRIAERASGDADTSYTAQLLGKGTATCAQKVGEEAVETVIAALNQDREALRNEAADLLFHLLVLLKAQDVSLDEVVAELARRTAQSGLAEKAARNS
ncbi:MAG: phosphoribosyl-ATP diphosphatase [Pseudomonadota bacterium]